MKLLALAASLLLLTSCIGQAERSFPWEEGADPDNPEQPVTGERSFLVLDFTATWCTNCPKMTAAIETLQSSGAIPVCVHCYDEMSCSASDKLIADFNASALPLAVINLDNETKTSVSSAEMLKSMMDSISASDPCVSTIDAVATLKDKQLAVSVSAGFLKEGRFALGVALTRNGLTAKQEGAPEGYVHNDVLLAFLNEGWPADDLGEQNAGSEILKNYSCLLESSVNSLNAVIFLMKLQADGKWTVNSAKKIQVN